MIPIPTILPVPEGQPQQQRHSFCHLSPSPSNTTSYLSSITTGQQQWKRHRSETNDCDQKQMNVKGFSSIKNNLHRSTKPANSTTSASSLPHPTRWQKESQHTEDDGSRRWRRCRRTSTTRRRKRESTTMLTSTVVVNSRRWLLKGTLLALLLLCLPTISAAIIFNSDEEPGIRCFCDKQTCGGGALVCAGKYCLIGVRTDESGQGRLDQHCVDEQILPGTATKGCVRDWKKWSEVCICEDSLCNTFAFLRSQIDGNNHEEGLHFANGNGGVGSSSGGAVQRSLYQPLDSQENDPHHNGNDELMMGGGSSSNGRGGRDPRREDAHYHHRRQQQHHSNGRGAPLVLLLVVLPLVVGAFTVFLVFVNYHCKML